MNWLARPVNTGPAAPENQVPMLAARTDGSATRRLFSLLSHPDSAVRTAVLHVLADREDPAVVDGLVDRLLRDPVRGVRQIADEALATRPPAVVASKLLIRLDAPDPHVRAAAGRALADRDDPAITDKLLDHLDDPDRHVRATVVRHSPTAQIPPSPAGC
jgi:hypothetical protein